MTELASRTRSAEVLEAVLDVLDARPELLKALLEMLETLPKMLEALVELVETAVAPFYSRCCC